MQKKLLKLNDLIKKNDLINARKNLLYILHKNPNDPNHNELLGLIEYKLKNYDSSIIYFKKSISLNPNSERYFYNYALVLKDKGLFEDSLNNFDKAIYLKKDFVEAMFNKGNLLIFLKKYDEAINIFLEILKINQNHFDTINNLAFIYYEKKNFNLALKNFDIALSISPNDLSIILNKINTLRQLGRLNEALQLAENTQNIFGDNVEVLTMIAILFEDFKFFDKSLSVYDKILNLKKNDSRTLYNKANLLKKLKRFEESLFFYNLAIKVTPEFFEALNNKAELLEHMQDYRSALKCYNEIIAIDPNNFEVLYNRSMLLIRLGEYEKGWKEHEFRWKTIGFKSQLRNFTKPKIKNLNEIFNKRILITHEQGLGDTIQFCRYLNLLKPKCEKIFFETPKNLLELLKKSFPEVFFFIKGSDIPNFDYYCPLMSLPMIFETSIDNIPNKTRYLKSIKVTNDETNKSSNIKKTKIGLAWSGNPNNPKDNIRSISINFFKKIFSLNLDFYCLQKDISQDEKNFISNYKNIFFLENDLINFNKSSVLCDEMNLVITVDTSIAHLSGALGKKTWLLLSYNPDYRWSLSQKKCIWYNSIELYRQKKYNDWDTVLDKVYLDLVKFL